MAKRETPRLEEVTLDKARGRILVIREIEGVLRVQVAAPVEGMKREEDQLRPRELEDLPVFDLSDQID
jgi:hypothetical protein